MANKFFTQWVTRKTTTFLDGTKKAEETQVNPEDISAMKAAGMSPDQIADVLKAIASSATEKPATIPGGITLKTVIDQYNQHRIRRRTQGGAETWEPPSGDSTKFRRLIEILGDVPISNIGREKARHVVDQLGRIPAKASPKLHGLTVDQIIAQAQPGECSEGATRRPRPLGRQQRIQNGIVGGISWV